MTRREIPPLIRRNTLLLAATQAFVGSGAQMVPTPGAIMIERLLGSLALAGLGTSIARILIAYPTGWVMDRYGRRAGLILGLLLCLTGSIGIGVAISVASFAVFLIGLNGICGKRLVPFLPELIRARILMRRTAGLGNAADCIRYCWRAWSSPPPETSWRTAAVLGREGEGRPG